MNTPASARANYFAEGEYIETNVKTGVMRNRAGTRMLALTNDFLIGLTHALDNECGPAARDVMKTCGRHWGQNYAKRFAREMEDFYGMAPAQMPLPMFETMLTESFSHHGWGRPRWEFDRYATGIVVVAVEQPIQAELIGSAEKPADQMLAGVLAGLFTELTGTALDCLQTRCRACGADNSLFVITHPARIRKVADWPEQGRSHEDILKQLEATRA